ncbi:MAG: hypothetical protein F4107_08590 [Gemmatimonadetes bacterium]|nr:hypothetical protein [Gemmatimonadota bacterium]MYD13967.1 hypothetical protein [Gemmatimonadota bacterium]MYI65974.1 hypothetical protein [Gemmatimonadota bacterium]
MMPDASTQHWKKSWERAMRTIHRLEREIERLRNEQENPPVAEFEIFEEGDEYGAAATVSGVALYAYRDPQHDPGSVAWTSAAAARQALSGIDGLRVDFEDQDR